MPKNSDELDKLFEKQFSSVELVGEGGEGIEIIDLHPPHRQSEVPIFVSPGWSETPKIYKNVMRNLYEYRRILLTVGHPRKGSEAISEPEHQIEELRKATNLLKVLEAKDLEQADFIAHSEGAINTTIAATISPEQFQSVVFVNPAGMIGEAKLLESVERFLEHMTYDFLKARRDHAIREQYRERQREALKYIAGNPFRAIKEAIATSKAEIHHLLEELHYDGIKLGILAGDDDALFPEERIRRYVKEDHIDAYRIIPGGHSDLHYHPEHYSKAIMSMLNNITVSQG